MYDENFLIKWYFELLGNKIGMIDTNANKNIKFGILLSYAAMAISLIGTLFVTNRVLNYIGDYNYGLYAFVNSITSWLTVVSSALTASYLRYATIDSKKDGNLDEPATVNTIYCKLLMSIGLIVLFVGGGVIFALYKFEICLGKYSWSDSKLMYCLFVVTLVNIALTMPTSIFSLYINFKQKFIFGKLLGIITTILNFAGHFVIAFFTKNVVLIAAFSLVVTILTFLCNYFYCKKIGITFGKASLHDYKPLVKSIVVFSSILLFNSIVDQVNSSVDKTLLGIFSTPESVTIYQMGQQFNTYLVTMSVAVSGVFAPRMHALVAEKNEQELSDLYLKISKAQTIVLCFVVFGFMACGKNFILWWIGPSRIDAFYVGLVLMLMDLCPLTMNSSIEIQRAENKHRFRALVYFLVAVANVILSIIFLWIFPIEKAIYACLLGSLLARIGSHWIAMNIYNKKEIHLPVGKYMLNLFIYMIVGFGCVVITYVLDVLFICKIDRTLFRFLIEGTCFVVQYLLVIGILNRKSIIEYLNLRKHM